METIGVLDAEKRLGELLERTERGETFRITRSGRPVGRLVPPEPIQESWKLEHVRKELSKFRGMLSGLTADERRGLTHEGHRY